MHTDRVSLVGLAAKVSVVHGEATRPLLGVADGLHLVDFPQFGDVVGERVVGIRCAEQRLNRQQHGADLQRRAPLVLENVEADAPQPVNVWVIDTCDEAHLRRRHRVVLRQEELQLEEAALERGVLRAGDDDVKVACVVLVGHGADAGHRLLHEAQRLLGYSTRQGCHFSLRAILDGEARCP